MRRILTLATVFFLLLFGEAVDRYVFAAVDAEFSEGSIIYTLSDRDMEAVRGHAKRYDVNFPLTGQFFTLYPIGSRNELCLRMTTTYPTVAEVNFAEFAFGVYTGYIEASRLPGAPFSSDEIPEDVMAYLMAAFFYGHPDAYEALYKFFDKKDRGKPCGMQRDRVIISSVTDAGAWGNLMDQYKVMRRNFAPGKKPIWTPGKSNRTVLAKNWAKYLEAHGGAVPGAATTTGGVDLGGVRMDLLTDGPGSDTASREDEHSEGSSAASSAGRADEVPLLGRGGLRHRVSAAATPMEAE